MKNLAWNHDWSALMVTMALMGILSFMMILLLEKIIPTSQATRGIENSTVALYHSSSAIEKAFASMNYKTPGSATSNGSLTLANSQEDGKYQITQSNDIIPIPGKGNSEYDSNWNRINSGNPVQLKINQSIITPGGLEKMVMDLRVPKLWSSDAKAGNTNSTTFFTGSTTYSMVSVSLTNGSGKGFTANYGPGCTDTSLQNNWLTANRINNPNPNAIKLWSLCMKNLSNGTIKSLSNHLLEAGNANLCTSGCTLKFSLVNKLQNMNGDSLPYLEYRIRNGAAILDATESLNCFRNYPPNNTCGVALGLGTSLALPFTTVDSEWVSYGFRRTNKRNLQQLTTSEELDFAVFQ